MSDLKSLDINDVDIDLSQISIKEWRSLSDPAQPVAEEFALISRVIGWEVEDIANINQPDYQRLIIALVLRAANPVSDPN